MVNRSVGIKMNSTYNESDTKALWKETDCVCFDVDSTVVIDEGVDELASFVGVRTEVANLTREAMSGSMTFKESLAKRMDIIQPSRKQIEAFISECPLRLTEGIKELVTLLKKHNIPIYLISGGFKIIIDPIADELGIPRDHIYANIIQFDQMGNYAAFDESCHTCETGGKPKVIKELKDRHGYSKLVHIGDGVTDMEVLPQADAFIGFGGNQIREKVKVGAPWFVMSFNDLISELNK